MLCRHLLLISFALFLFVPKKLPLNNQNGFKFDVSNCFSNDSLDNWFESRAQIEPLLHPEVRVKTVSFYNIIYFIRPNGRKFICDYEAFFQSYDQKKTILYIPIDFENLNTFVFIVKDVCKFVISEARHYFFLDEDIG